MNFRDVPNLYKFEQYARLHSDDEIIMDCYRRIREVIAPVAQTVGWSRLRQPGAGGRIKGQLRSGGEIHAAALGPVPLPPITSSPRSGPTNPTTRPAWIIFSASEIWS